MANPISPTQSTILQTIGHAMTRLYVDRQTGWHLEAVLTPLSFWIDSMHVVRVKGELRTHVWGWAKEVTRDGILKIPIILNEQHEEEIWLQIVGPMVPGECRISATGTPIFVEFARLRMIEMEADIPVFIW